MAFFGITDVVVNLEHTDKTDVYHERLGSVLPSWEDLRICGWSIARGTGLGSILGILPGGGALLASFAAYMFEKKIAKPPRNFGQGDIRGVAAPESANNAGAQTSFIPMLTLGIPSNPTMALMIGAMMIQGIAPGPQVMTERPELFWGLIASMWVGNLMLLVLNLPLVGLWIKLLAVPYRLLFPAIFVFCCIGAYTRSEERRVGKECRLWWASCFSSRRRHTRLVSDWSSDVCSSDLPQVMTERPELFWGLIASMWVGNLMLLVLNLPLVGLWIKLLAVPYRLLFPAIFVFCCIGAYTRSEEHTSELQSLTNLVCRLLLE